MFMKLLLSFTLSLLFCFQVSSQDKASKLLLSYSQQELDQINQSDSEKYQLLEYALDHALTTEPYVKLKHAELEKVSLKTDNSNPSFTDFRLKIKDERQYFLWKEKSVVISVSPFNALNHLKKLNQ